MTRPFASRECWCSPRNIGRAPPGPFRDRHTWWGKSSPFHHQAPPYDTIHPSTHFAPPLPHSRPLAPRASGRTPGITRPPWSIIWGCGPSIATSTPTPTRSSPRAKEEAEQIRRDALVTAEGIRRIALEDATSSGCPARPPNSTPALTEPASALEQHVERLERKVKRQRRRIDRLEAVLLGLAPGLSSGPARRKKR